MLKYLPGVIGFVCLVAAAFILFGIGWALAVAGILSLLVDRRLS